MALGVLALAGRVLGAFLLWLVLAVAAQTSVNLLVLRVHLSLLLAAPLGAALAVLVALGVAWMFRVRLDHLPWAGMRLRGGLAPFGLVAGVALGATAIAAVLAITSAQGQIRSGPLNQPTTFLLALAAFLGVAFGEEVLFRGYLLQTLGERVPLWSALLVSSLLFGLAHSLAEGLTLGSLMAVVVLGMALDLLRLLSGSLWLTIGFHTAWSFIANGSLVPLSGRMADRVDGTLAAVIVLGLVAIAALAALTYGRWSIDWSAQLRPDGGVRRLR